MAGFRNFVTGEILTAANVDDFLMKQSVQKFADAAARDAALGTAVAGGNALREGMVSYLDDEDEVQYFDGTAWDAISQPPPGIGSNVVQTVKTDTFTTTSSAYQNITGLSVTVTPTSASSKILLLVNAHVGSGGPGSGNGASGSIRVDGGNAATFVGDASGSLQRGASGVAGGGETIGREAFRRASLSSVVLFVDSPSTTSATTYQVQLRSSDSRASFINRAVDESNNESHSRLASSIIAIEVAA